MNVYKVNEETEQPEDGREMNTTELQNFKDFIIKGGKHTTEEVNAMSDGQLKVAYAKTFADFL